MESFGNFFDEEWDNLSRMFSGDQDSDRFTGHGLFPSEHDHGLNFEIPTILVPASNEFSNANSFVADDGTFVYASDHINPNFYHFFSQESSNSSSGASNGMVSLPYPCHGSYQFCPSNIIPSPSNDVCDQSLDFCMRDEINPSSSLPTQVFSDDAMKEILCLTQDVAADEDVKMESSIDSGRQTPLKRKFEMPEPPNAVDEEVNTLKIDNEPKKKTRVSRDNKNKKNLQPKRNHKKANAITNSHVNDVEDSNNNGEAGNGQTSSSCSSEDVSNGSQDVNGALNSNGKTRANRGTATDPQSLYARKRRERINERLRILQNLVPNGTKVDISTMLEEAVQYVKFLKLQIKLLSSDDMWMYAPIAYNGMDMGLYQNIAPTL